MIIKNHFHKEGSALNLVLKQRLAASRKWPIRALVSLPVPEPCLVIPILPT